MACWNCDLCNQQAPSHSKHAISPQTEACFSTTHGFNWRLLLLLLLLCLQLREKRARHSSTNLIMKSVAGRQIELAVSLSRGYFCGGLAEEEMAVYLSLEKSLSFCMCLCVCLCVNRPVFKLSLQRQQGKLFTTWLVVKSKYASVGAYQRLLHLVPG